MGVLLMQHVLDKNSLEEPIILQIKNWFEIRIFLLLD